MLQINVPEGELYDSEHNQFVYTNDTILQLEHSLLSLSKWESKWLKPFLVKGDKTPEEMLDYIRCMTMNKNVDPNVYSFLTQENIDQIVEYIEHPMTATTINDTSTSKSRSRIMTSELIYCRMLSYEIPFECQKWHLNRLIMLIRVCEAENKAPDKNKSTKQTALDYAALNAERRKNKKRKDG